MNNKKEVTKEVTASTEATTPVVVTTSAVVKGFNPSVSAMKCNRAEFLNKGLSIDLGKVMVTSFFAGKEHMKEGIVQASAPKVFCQLEFISGDNKLTVLDDWAVVNKEFSEKGKELLTIEGNAIEQVAGIVNGKYEM